MEIALHRGTPVDFITSYIDEVGTGEPSSQTQAITIVGGGISRRNLRNKLARDNIEGTGPVNISTIDDISETLHSVAGTNVRLLPEQYLHRLIEEILQLAEEDELIATLPDFQDWEDKIGMLETDNDGWEAHRDVLAALADEVPYQVDETVETIYEEVNDFYRCTDAGANCDKLLAIADDLEHAYANKNTEQRLEQFSALTDVLEVISRQANDGAKISRSHFVSHAREHVKTHWVSEYGQLDWLAVSTISIFDNPTLRLLLEIGSIEEGPELHFFLGAGSYNRQKSRLESLSDVNIVESDEPAERYETFGSDGAANFMKSARGNRSAVTDDMRFVSAPERQREVQYVLTDIQEKLQQGADPNDIVILTRDVSRYESHVRDLFETSGLPYHIDTQMPLAQQTGYRFLQETCDLIQKAAAGDAIRYDELTAPIRLGLCVPSENQYRWPLRGIVFLNIEQELHKRERRADDDLTFDDWKSIVADVDGWEAAWGPMAVFMEWVDKKRDEPPATGSELQQLIRTLVGIHLYQTVPQVRQRDGGPGVDLTRNLITELHSTSTASRVFQQASSAGNYYEYVLKVFDSDASWEEASRAIGEGIGSETLRQANTDANAIRILDAGDAVFVDAEHVYLIGLSAGEFPAERNPASVLHEQLRTEVATRAEAGEAPLLRLASERTQYAIDLDYYETALRVSTDQVTVVHNYKDSGGNTVQWSSFVDLLPVENNEEVIRADEWLPEPDKKTTANWAELSARSAEKDRIRLLTHHSERDYPTERRPAITADAIKTIAGQCDAETFNTDIMARHRRYYDPPTEITVDPDESAFDEVAFEDIVGEPIRTHELDLYSQCQLKYYFYMLLFNYNGESAERERIPFYSSRRPHWRFGRIPRVLRDQRISSGRRKKLEYLIEDEFDDRYELTDRFDSHDEIERWFEEADEFSEYDLNPLVPLIQNEWQLVQQEEAANESGQRSSRINREWTWQDWDTVEIDGTEVRFEPHRRDIIHNDDGYVLPVFHVRHPSYAKKALKNCWESDDYNYRQPEACDGICSRCDDLNDCSIPTKYTLDHRLHTSDITIDSLSGVVMAEQYQRGPDGRDGLIKAHHLDELRDGIEGGPEGTLDDYDRTLPNGAWRARASSWETDITDHLAEMTGDGMASFSVDDQFVADGACEECVYREMCFVPQSGDHL